MKQHTINLYNFDELSAQAKERAVCDHIDFEIEVMDNNSPYLEYAEEMDKMQTPWFLGEVIYEKEKDSIIDTIKATDYHFFENGELAPPKYYAEDFKKAA